MRDETGFLSVLRSKLKGGGEEVQLVFPDAVFEGFCGVVLERACAAARVDA